MLAAMLSLIAVTGVGGCGAGGLGSGCGAVAGFATRAGPGAAVEVVRYICGPVSFPSSSVTSSRASFSSSAIFVSMDDMNNDKSPGSEESGNMYRPSVDPMLSVSLSVDTRGVLYRAGSMRSSRSGQ